MPSVLAQATGSTTTTAAETPAPHKKKTAKRRNARKRAKLKSDASKVIEKGVDKAGANLTGK
jgi:cell division septum initiation protein DivIVA